VACICAGFKNRCSNIEDPQAAHSASDLEDSSPDPHDNELRNIPDMETMDKAVADFLSCSRKRNGATIGYMTHTVAAAIAGQGESEGHFSLRCHQSSRWMSWRRGTSPLLR
jgi:hypothetical protein